MMTKIETDALNAVIGIHREMKKANGPDWERRRYEIAKDIFAKNWAMLPNGQMAAKAVAAADALIKELRKGGEP